MADPYMGEIKIFAGNYAPHNWAFCDGQLLAIASYQALYSLLSTFYGGDGRNTFALPDLRGRLPMHFGDGPGLLPRPIGQRSGQERVTVTEQQMPPHNHIMQATLNDAMSETPIGNLPAQAISPFYSNGSDATAFTSLPDDVVSNTGGSESHYNMMPYLCLNFIICVTGPYPPRS